MWNRIEELPRGYWSIPRSVPVGELRQEEIKIPVSYDLSLLPTWALIEELKNRPGVVYRANATDKGLVGWFEHAPAIILGVKLPVNDEV